MPHASMPASFHYREYDPGPRLAGVVECFWTSTGDGAAQDQHHRILPDGCMDLLFDFGTTSADRARVVGTMSRALIYSSSGPQDLLGVRCRPGALSSFVRLDAAELTDRQVDLGNFWGPRADASWHRLGEAGITRRIRMLQVMLEQDGPAQVDRYIQHCVSRIEGSDGSVRIAELEAGTGIGARQLERSFARHLGVAPKTFARIVRFKRVIAAAEASNGPVAWAQLAADLGFSDQAHLVREFKALSGLSPVQFQAGAAESATHVGFLQDE